MRPLMSLPIEMVRREADDSNSSLSITARRLMTSRRRVGDFNSDRHLAGNTFDQNRFRLQTQAEIFAQIRDLAVFDARFRLEFESGDNRAGIDLHHGAQDVEFFEFYFDRGGDILQFLLVESGTLRDFVQQIRGRQPVNGGQARTQPVSWR